MSTLSKKQKISTAKRTAALATTLAKAGIKHPVKKAIKAEEESSWQKFKQGRLDPSNSFGRHVGSFFGGDLGSKVGGLLQGGFRKITGFGDYDTVSAPLVRRSSYKQRAKSMAGKFFKNISEGNGQYYGSGPMPFVGRMAPRIRHKEFITNINGTTSFARYTNGISPTNSFLFPWLSKFAYNFQQYRIHGMEFYFETTSSDYTATQALGSVMMATQYDVKERELDDTVQILDHEFSTSSRPNNSFYHPVECAPGREPIKILYVRDAGEEENSFNTFGKFVYATDGNAGTGIIGRLWVTYDIEFLKPRLPQQGSEPGLTFWQLCYGLNTLNSSYPVNSKGGPAGIVGILPNPLSTYTMAISLAGSLSNVVKLTFPVVSTTRRFLVEYALMGPLTTSAVSSDVNYTTTGCVFLSPTGTTLAAGINMPVPASTVASSSRGITISGVLISNSNTVAPTIYFEFGNTLTDHAAASAAITVVELPEAWSSNKPLTNDQRLQASKRIVILPTVNALTEGDSDNDTVTIDMIPDTNLPIDQHVERLQQELDQALRLRHVSKLS